MSMIRCKKRYPLFCLKLNTCRVNLYLFWSYKDSLSVLHYVKFRDETNKNDIYCSYRPKQKHNPVLCVGLVQILRAYKSNYSLVSYMGPNSTSKPHKFYDFIQD